MTTNSPPIPEREQQARANDMLDALETIGDVDVPREWRGFVVRAMLAFASQPRPASEQAHAEPERLPILLREHVVGVLQCESEPHVIEDAVAIVNQAAAALLSQREQEGWTALRTLQDAETECRRVSEETTFADDVLPGERGWFKRGAQTCAAMMGMLAKNVVKHMPLPTAPKEGGADRG